MSRKTTPLTGSIVPKQGKTGRLAGAVSGKPLGVDVEEAELRGAIVGPVSATEAAALALSPPQRIAIEKMTSGDTLIDAAEAAGVSRMTLYRWLKQDPRFAAAYNAWQQDVLATSRGRLLALTDTAAAGVGITVLPDPKITVSKLRSGTTVSTSAGAYRTLTAQKDSAGNTYIMDSFAPFAAHIYRLGASTTPAATTTVAQPADLTAYTLPFPANGAASASGDGNCKSSWLADDAGKSTLYK